jgi:AhpD family alkylhydroperoxidase
VSAAPRIDPGSLRETGPFAWGFSRAAGVVMRSGPPNLFRTMGRHPRLFRGWLRFAGRLMPGGKLPRRETELVILRVAHLRSCAYEYDHHVRLARRAGLSRAEIERVADGPAAPGWSQREQILLRAVDELHHTGDLADGTWGALREHLDARLAIEFVMLVAHYEMLATFIGTLRIQPDGQAGSRAVRSEASGGSAVPR